MCSHTCAQGHSKECHVSCGGMRDTKTICPERSCSVFVVDKCYFVLEEYIHRVNATHQRGIRNIPNDVLLLF